MESTELELEAYQHQSCVRGHHIYKGVWSPTVGEKLKCEREPSNGRDPYAVAVYKRDQVVGHIPRIISAACSVFIQRGGSIDCTITGSRRFSVDLPQEGLEIPCLLKFRGDGKDIKKVIKLLSTAEKMVTAEQEANKRKPEESPDLEAKKMKLDVDIIDLDEIKVKSSCDQAPWLAFRRFELTLVDKDIIISGDLLTDRHINFAQALIKKEHKELIGLESTLLLARSMIPPLLQLVHARGSHWIVLSTIGCTNGLVKVFDSLYNEVDKQTMDLIHHLYGSEIKVVLEESPKQVGLKDCGLFAIATATQLANGCIPKMFDQNAMRGHLLTCFEKLQIRPFP